MSDRNTGRDRAALLALLGSTALTMTPVAAMAQAPAEADAATSIRQDEVVVTARKREERLQDVPMSLSAIGGEALETAGYTELSDLSRLTSNVFFEAADRTKPLIFVRGIGTRGYDAGSDPSVGVFVDGVYQGRFGALDMDLLDVERIEVLKGPQGTLYGRNTIGGALSVITRDPSEQFRARAAAEIGASEISGDMLYGVNGSISGPLADKAYGLISVSHRYRDGYQPVSGTDVRGGSEDSWSARAKTLFEFDGGATLRLSGDYARMDGPPLILTPNDLGSTRPNPGPLTPGFTTPSEPVDPYRPSSDRNDQAIVKDVYGVSAQVDWSWGKIDFTSISAYRGMEFDERDDLDGTTLPFQFYLAQENSDQVSQEVRAAFSGESFNWLFGLYYSKEEVTRSEGIDFGPASLLSALVAPAPLAWGFGFDLESTSVAAFGQLEWTPTEKFAATFGARYSEEEKNVVFNTTTTVPGFIITPFVSSVSRKWDSFDPSLSVRYKFTDDVMAYASWATGYKSGAFQFIATSPLVANQVANPEDVESTEVGVKSTLFDGRVRLNAAAFTMDYTDLQQLRVTPVAPGVSLVVINNAASSTIQGFELEGGVKLTENWSVDVNYGYLDATFDKYQFNPTLDFSGNRMARSPENTYTIALNFEAPSAWGPLDARLAYAWRDEIFFEADNNTVDPESSEGALGLLDFSAGLTRDKWRFSLWGRNLTDERYRRQVLNSTGNAQRGIWAEPRTYGVKVGYSFGE